MVINLDADFSRAYFNRAIAKEKTFEELDAISDYESAIEIN